MAAEGGIYSTASAEEAAAEPRVNITPQLSAEGEILVPYYAAAAAADSSGDGETFTIDEAIEQVGFGKYQVLVLLMVDGGFVLDRGRDGDAAALVQRRSPSSSES